MTHKNFPQKNHQIGEKNQWFTKKITMICENSLIEK